MWGNSENSAAVSDSSLTMAENWFLGALIVTSTMPLEREILASLRTLDASGLLLLDSVSENLLIATTRVLMLASFPLSCWTWGWMNSAREWKFMDRKSTRLNSSHGYISYAVFCLKKKKKESINVELKLRYVVN